MYQVSVDNGVIPLGMHIGQLADLALAPGAIRLWSKSSRAPHHQPDAILILYSHAGIIQWTTLS